MTMDELTKQMTALQEAVGGVGKASHGTHEEIKGLSRSLLSYGKIFTATFLGHAAEQLAAWVFKQAVGQREILKTKLKEFELKKKEYDQAERLLQMNRLSGVVDAQRIRDLKEIVSKRKGELEMLARETGWREGIRKLVEDHKAKNVVMVGLASFVLDKTRDLLAMSHEYNAALMQANTNVENRFGLIGKTLNVQRELGISTHSMAESVQALVEYGHDLNPAFQSNLKVVSMLKEGLGVSARTGAQLVTIFTKQMREGAEKVGDVIATIAQQTGLAAERAAEFAIEIGRSLRLLGAGGSPEASGVTRFITGLAGRIHEMGGNAGAVVQMFKQMSGGTAQAFFMRGFAGIRPGALGTETGAEAAMRGLAGRMNAIITAPEKTEAFLAQVQAVSEMTGMAADDIIDFREAMSSLKKPVTEAQALQRAYNEQSALLGKSFSQLREAVQALIMKGMLPIMPYVTKTVEWLAGVARSLASWEPLVPIVAVVIPAAAGVAVVSLTRLGWAITKFALQSKAAEDILGTGGLGNIRKILTTGGLKGLLRTPAWGAGSIGGFAGFAAGVGAAGLGLSIGAAIGTFMDKKIPDNLLSQWAKGFFDWVYDNKSAQTKIATRTESIFDTFAKQGHELAEAIAYKQDTSAIIKRAFETEAQWNRDHPGHRPLTAGVGAERVMGLAEGELKNIVTSVVMSRGTRKTAKDLRDDAEMKAVLENLELQKAQLDTQIQTARAAQKQEELLKRQKEEEDKRKANQAWQQSTNPAANSQSRSYFFP